MKRLMLTCSLVAIVFAGVQAQEHVLAWDHVGAVQFFRITINGKTIRAVPTVIPDAGSHQYEFPLSVTGAVDALVEACNAVGVCASSQPLVIPAPAAPTTLRAQAAGIIGNNIPIRPDPVGGGSLPAAPSSPSPANSATGVSITPTFTATTGADFTNCKIRLDTANPPITEIDLGTTCQYSPGSLVYNTVYRWRFVLTNGYGETVGAIWTLTTLVDPGPPPDPDPGCSSMTASSTGYQPISWTSCRQDAMNAMKANYEAHDGIGDPADCDTNCNQGGKWFKEMKSTADATGIYNDIGQFDVWMYQATGDPTYAARAYTHLDAYFITHEASGFCAAPNTTLRKGLSSNSVREGGIRWVRYIDTISPDLTAPQNDRLKLIVGELLAEALRLNCASTQGMALNDSDFTIGVYFAIVNFYLRYPTYQPAIDLYASPVIGGLTATKTPEEYAASTTGNTARDAIDFYLWLAEGGEGPEGSEYWRGTINLLIEGIDGVRTLAGVDHFASVTAWLPTHAAWVRETLTPDLTQPFPFQDVESNPRHFERDHYTMVLGNLSGYLRGTTEGRKCHDLLEELVSLHGYQSGVSGSMFPRPHHHPFFLYDPGETAVEWRGVTGASTDFTATRKSHATATNASMLMVYNGGPWKYSSVSHRSWSVQHAELDHEHMNWHLYRNSIPSINHILDYGGPNGVGGDGGNVSIVHGWAGVEGYRNFAATHAGDYSYVVSTNGGSKTATQYCGLGNTPDIYLHEKTRSLVYVPGTTDIVVTYDRLNALPTVPETNCYPTAVNTRRTLFDAFHHKLLINHMYNLPTLVGNAYTWMTEAVENARMTVTHPATFTSTIINETTGTSYWSAWATKVLCGNCQSWQARYHARVAPTDNVQWNTFLTVHEIGTLGTITAKSDAGKVEGAHIVRSSGADLLMLFNSEPGANINSTYRHESHDNDLSVVRYRETGFTISWTAVSASGTLLILSDLNPANSWTLDSGAGPGAITEDANGQYSVTISGTGAKTITVVGS